jgi:hypothetical protein
MNEMISEITESLLSGLGLSVEIDTNYNFRGNGKKWLAVYEMRSRKICNNVIAIAINYHLFYDEMKRRGIENDDFNIEAQAKITVGHEIGHGLCDYFRNIKGMRFKFSTNDEEEIVEEFGESMFPDATGVYYSELGDFISDLNNKAE